MSNRLPIVGADGMTFQRMFQQLPTQVNESRPVTDVLSAWENAMTKEYEILKIGDVSAGWRLTDDTGKIRDVRWQSGTPDSFAKLSLRDFADVYFYHGFLHDRIGRGPQSPRTLVESIPGPYQDRLGQIVIAGALANSIVLHCVLSDSKLGLCPESCPERVALEAVQSGVSPLPT